MEYRISVKTMTPHMQNKINARRGGYREYVFRTLEEAQRWEWRLRALTGYRLQVEQSKLFLRTEGNVHHYVRQYTIRDNELTITTDRMAILKQRYIETYSHGAVAVNHN